MISILAALVIGQGLPVKDSNSSVLWELNHLGHGAVGLYAPDGGVATIGDTYGSGLVFSEGRVDTARDTVLFRDAFPGTTVGANNRWMQSLSTMTATVGAGALTLNAGASTAINTYATLSTTAKYRGFGDGAIQVIVRARPNNLPQTNAVAEIGLGNATANTAPTDGVFFRWTSSGGFECVINRGGAEQSQAMSAPASGVYSVFSLTASSVSVVCEWVTPSSGAFARSVLALDSGAPSVFVESPGAMLRVYNGGVAPALAPQLLVGLVDVSTKTVDLAGRNDARDVAQGLMAAYTPTTGAQSTNHTNSTSPTSATLSNTAAGYATLGGRYQFAAVGGAVTDFALFGYQVPTSYRLLVTRVKISTCLEGAAIATTATRLDWAVGVGSTAVSLATADATGAAPTSAPRRIPIGSRGFSLVAPRGPAQIGDCVDDIDVSFSDAPLSVESGRFFHIILQVPVGTATASQIFRGTVTVAGRFEQ